MNDVIKNTIKDLSRALPWLIITILCITGLYFYAPNQIGLLAWTLTKVSMGAFLGYWIDRSIFYYARPKDVDMDKDVFIHSCYRRSIIIAAAVIACGLGL